MKKNRNIIYTALAFILITSFSGCSDNKNIKNVEDKEVISDQVFPVKVSKVIKEKVERNIDYTSSIEPFEQVYFSPAQPGRIEKIFVEVGDHVKKGDLLVQMDEIQLEQAEIQLKQLKTDYDRLDTLKKVGSIADQKYEQIKAQYEVTVANVEFLRENIQLKAPFTGIISGKYYEDGEMFSGAPNTPAGKAAVISLVQIHPSKLIVNLSETYFPKIKKGVKAVITTDIYPNQEFVGDVFRIHPTIDVATRTFKIEIKIQNPDEKLRPGMFVRSTLNIGSEKTILIPTTAVLKQTGTNNMYIFVNENNVAIRKSVEVGKIFDDQIEIVNGLNEGEQLIVSGQSKLENQVKIEIVE